ncbi:MAG: hypothetical protein HZB39_03020 [Planctomycetes bacterium]|nr:hypothetical protein [Planctomycetota bacterium]
MRSPLLPFLVFLAAAATVTSCGGGGGGGAPGSVLPKLLIDDLTVSLASPRGALIVGLAGMPGELPPLAQFDLAADGTRIAFDGTAESIVATATLDAELVSPGRVRVVVGDAMTKDSPPPLPSGALLRLPFALGPSARAGDVVEVRALAPLGADAGGGAKAFDTAPVVARVTVR